MPVGPMELLIILIIVVLIFGAGKLPQVGSALGRSIREFRSETTADEDDKQHEVDPKQARTPRSRGDSV